MGQTLCCHQLPQQVGALVEHLQMVLLVALAAAVDI
jgi:hypothetical protein